MVVAATAVAEAVLEDAGQARDTVSMAGLLVPEVEGPATFGNPQRAGGHSESTACRPWR